MTRSVAELTGRSVRRRPLPLDVNWPLPDNLMGIELEIDNPPGVRRPIADSTELSFWTRHNDASLQNGREYVLRSPQAGKELCQAISEIMVYGPFNKNMTGSTHVHMDMLDEATSHETLRILILLVYTLEPVLYAIGDKGRMFCGYCNSMESGDANVIRDAMDPDIDASTFRTRYTRGSSHTPRYYGLNLLALGDYGSVEFRYFPTASTPEELVRYVTLVQCFKRAALALSSVEQLLDIYNEEDTFNSFIRTHFEDFAELFHNNVNYISAASNLQKARIVCALPERNTNTRVNLDAVISSKKWQRILKKATSRKITLHELRSGSDSLPSAPKRGDIMLYSRNIYMWVGDNWLSLDVCRTPDHHEYNRLINSFNTKQHLPMFQTLVSEHVNGARRLGADELRSINEAVRIINEGEL